MQLCGGAGNFKDATAPLPMRARRPFLLELSDPRQGPRLLGFHRAHLSLRDKTRTQIREYPPFQFSLKHGGVSSASCNSPLGLGDMAETVGAHKRSPHVCMTGLRHFGNSP